MSGKVTDFGKLRKAIKKLRKQDVNLLYERRIIPSEGYFSGISDVEKLVGELEASLRAHFKELDKPPSWFQSLESWGGYSEALRRVLDGKIGGKGAE